MEMETERENRVLKVDDEIMKWNIHDMSQKRNHGLQIE